MFRLTCYVEDRDLPSVMHALSGKVKELNVQSVAGTNPALTKPVHGLTGRPSNNAGSRPPNGQPAHRMMVEEFRRQGLTEVLTPKIKEVLEYLGMPTSSYSHYLHNAMRDGLIKQGGKNPNGLGMIWKIVPKKAGE